MLEPLRDGDPAFVLEFKVHDPEEEEILADTVAAALRQIEEKAYDTDVLDAMGGVLGNQVSQLTVGEMELLILAASLHDLGMVYTEEEKRRHFQDAEACGKFLREYRPEYLDCPAEDWTEDIRQWYLRTLHPFRIPEVLQNEVWKDLFAACPQEVMPKRYILVVSKAHGQNPQDFLRNKIDATLLRGKMETGFIPEHSRIDIWEWSDKEGNIWFRMDDQGTGMTLGMRKRYFLKVGNLNPGVPFAHWVIELKDRFLRANATFTGYESSEGVLYVLFMPCRTMHPEYPSVFEIYSFDHVLDPRSAKRLTEIFLS